MKWIWSCAVFCLMANPVGGQEKASAVSSAESAKAVDPMKLRAHYVQALNMVKFGMDEEAVSELKK